MLTHQPWIPAFAGMTSEQRAPIISVRNAAARQTINRTRPRLRTWLAAGDHYPGFGRRSVILSSFNCSVILSASLGFLPLFSSKKAGSGEVQKKAPLLTAGAPRRA